MLYNLSKPTDKSRFTRRVKQLLSSTSLVELTEKKERRTLPQNSYLHLLLGWFAIETGNTIDFVKREYFKRLVNKDLFVSTKVADYVGEVEVIRSSRDLDSEQMTTAIDRFRKWSSEVAGIYLPTANERDFLKDIESEMAQYQRFI
jgi:hypothetical protein